MRWCLRTRAKIFLTAPASFESRKFAEHRPSVITARLPIRDLKSGQYKLILSVRDFDTGARRKVHPFLDQQSAGFVN
jgi:hypothetical protein